MSVETQATEALLCITAGLEDIVRRLDRLENIWLGAPREVRESRYNEFFGTESEANFVYGLHQAALGQEVKGELPRRHKKPEDYRGYQKDSTDDHYPDETES